MSIIKKIKSQKSSTDLPDKITAALFQNFNTRKWNASEMAIGNKYSWRADFLSMTENGTVFEYEIKISLSDFKSDFKKQKHSHMGKYESAKLNPTRFSRFDIEVVSPNHFSYVVPFDLLPKVADLVPCYAGLFSYNHNNNSIQQIKSPPRIHGLKTLEDYEALFIERVRHKYKNLWFDYWSLNNKEEE